MKHNKAIIALLAIGSLAGATALAAPQTKCPVMGGKIDKSQYADVNGKRIYVCCPGCIGKIKAATDKYIKQLKAEGVELEKTTGKEATSASKSGCCSSR